jgi:hypothetical protein
MCKSYAVVFQNKRSGKVGMDKFTAISSGAARKDFFDCYRHENYSVLSVTEIPEIGK